MKIRPLHDKVILKREEEAKDYAKKWIAFDELNDEAHRILGQIEIATGNPKVGLQELKEAVDKTIQKLKDSGELDKLIDDAFKASIEK